METPIHSSEKFNHIVVLRELTALLRLHDVIAKANKRSKSVIIPLLLTIMFAFICMILAGIICSCFPIASEIKGGWILLGILIGGVAGGILGIWRNRKILAREIPPCQEALEHKVGEIVESYTDVVAAIGQPQNLYSRTAVVDMLALLLRESAIPPPPSTAATVEMQNASPSASASFQGEEPPDTRFTWNSSVPDAGEAPQPASIVPETYTGTPLIVRYDSVEKLPPGKDRCPKCAKLFDITPNKIKGSRFSAMEMALLGDVGMEQVRVRCPHCGTLYDLCK